MAASLKVIALVSGGKDSFFSMLHCLAQGHEVVALANLHPPPRRDADAGAGPESGGGGGGGDGGSEEDLNSYMYQTVGHGVVPLYEEALGIPLFRQEIRGWAVNSERDYSGPPPGPDAVGAGDGGGSDSETAAGDDETEDLVPLLRKVMAARPDANAVSTGAILSTYQRTRVESVALRLGLAPLSFLWQYPLLPPYSQSALLRDMAAVGQDARIIKVASGGLDEGFLWANVADYRTIARVGKAIGRFSESSDGAVLGEGGEFETLAIDGPGVLWKRRIEVESDGVVVQDGGTAIWKGKNARVVEKTEGLGTVLDALRIPDMFDEEFKKVLDSVDSTEEDADASGKEVQPTEGTWEHLPVKTVCETSNTLAISNLASTEDGSSSPSEQLRSILSQLDVLLSSQNLRPSSVAHCTLLLRNMSDFTVLNPIYASYFHATNPPARVTVAVGDSLPTPHSVMLSIILDKEPPSPDPRSRPSRQGLHVQSRSYWAPANIGPYSQAISTPLPHHPSADTDAESNRLGEIIYVAGQIPLVPASMDVYTDRGFEGQAVLSLQHLWRIGRAKGVRWWTAGVAYISECGPGEAGRRVRSAQRAWRAVHARASADDDEEDEAEDVDPWDRRNQGQAFNDNTERARIPNWDAVSGPREGGGQVDAPPCFVVQVASLPRGVDIEWSSTGLTHSALSVERPSGRSAVASCTVPRGASPRFYAVEIVDGGKEEVEALKGLGAWTSGTLYAGPGFPVESMGTGGVQWVPCKGVWGEDGKTVKGVLVGRVDAET
ncbi:adenine nucleotide alpha hydrolases-like protein [Corynespora cassiicola Philippines]|uniref:Diphthine--ammonia ligase n=1 Tax=Corynespora cassiicola Philippines TaxID=1448308 RepID=A0A2T2NJP8_CORCC|nr:adenine nucleotide alpha hydrolases-like protein [Corynespora cassiicola Philippines]